MSTTSQQNKQQNKQQQQNNNSSKQQQQNNNNNSDSSFFQCSSFFPCCGILSKTSNKHSATVRATNNNNNNNICLSNGNINIEEEKAAAVVNEKKDNDNNKTETNNNNNNKSEIVITSEPQKQINETTINKTKETNEEELIFRRKDDWTEEEITHWCPNDYEKNLVKLTWSDDFDFLYELGTNIYTYIFDHTPQAKLLFIKIHRHGDKWRESSDFRSQALKFVQTISYAAKNIYYMEECLQMRLFEIGENHVRYSSRGFKLEYWDIFLDAMEHALINHIASNKQLDAKQKADATRVWRQMASYIIVHMKHGFLSKQGEENNKRGTPPTSKSSNQSV